MRTYSLTTTCTKVVTKTKGYSLFMFPVPVAFNALFTEPKTLLEDTHSSAIMKATTNVRIQKSNE